MKTLQQSVLDGEIFFARVCLRTADINPLGMSWYKFLNSPRSYEELYNAGRTASSWVTCACGNQDYRIPRENNFGEPLDRKLSDLGVKFYNIIIRLRDQTLVMNEGYELKPHKVRALRAIGLVILSRIDKRAIEILKSQGDL